MPSLHGFATVPAPLAKPTSSGAWNYNAAAPPLPYVWQDAPGNSGMVVPCLVWAKFPMTYTALTDTVSVSGGYNAGPTDVFESDDPGTAVRIWPGTNYLGTYRTPPSSRYRIVPKLVSTTDGAALIQSYEVDASAGGCSWIELTFNKLLADAQTYTVWLAIWRYGA